MARKDLLSRLADAGEEAIAKLAESPGGDRMMGAVNSMRERVDELQRRVRGIDELERRVTELERRVGVESPTEAGAADASGAGVAEEEAPQAEDVPLLVGDAGAQEGVGDVGDPSTLSPTPPATPPPPVPPAPVEGGASDAFAESAASAEVAGDVPYVSGDRAEPGPEPPASPEPEGDRPPRY